MGSARRRKWRRRDFTANAGTGPKAPRSTVLSPEEGPRIWRRHTFDLACERNGIEHRTTKPAHPWTNGQVERMNRTLKDAAVRRYHYSSHDELRQQL